MDHTFSNTCRWVQDKEFIKKYVEKIQDAKNNLDTLFDELKEQIEKDLCTVTKENVIEESTANISKYQRWIDRLYQVQTKVNNLNTKLSRMETELYHYYKFNCDISDKIKSESAAQRYMDGNECRNALKEYICNNEALLTFINFTVKNLHNRNFAIKNVVDAWSNELGL